MNMDFWGLSNKPIILSIRPEHAERIYSGQKKYELRRVIPKENFDIVFLFETDGKDSITGFIKVGRILYEEKNKLWDMVNKKATTQERFFKYFNSVDKGYALEVASFHEFDTPINKKEILAVYPEFVTPQSFAYARDFNLLKILGMYMDEALRRDDAIEIREIENPDHEEYIKLTTKHIGENYDDIDEGFGSSNISSSMNEVDPYGYFTLRKRVYSVYKGDEKIGYTTLTFKRGGSVKSGPTILFEQFRKKGYGQQLRKRLEMECVKEGFRKIYCTCPDSAPAVQRYLLKSGYFIEAHLAKQYAGNHNELVFGKILSKAILKPSINLYRRRCKVPHIGHSLKNKKNKVREFIGDNFSKVYCDIDERFIDNVMTVAEGLQITDYAKKVKKIYICEDMNGQIQGIVITTPKRGRSVKLTPVLMFEDDDGIARTIKRIETDYMKLGFRKLYYLFPLLDGYLVEKLYEHDYFCEGVLKEPYKRGCDCIVLSKFLKEGQD